MQDRRTVFEDHTLAGRQQVKAARPVSVGGRELAALQAKLVQKH